ncbi:hypothetical protein BKA61DRAFT_581506 [Leptodontidium sp. MPI-SDFR-AT-0119]|nr:hypothetical protein BKA61DRAFT_581506 [Leptodontidium sp. MPI-SDFR-AT-0119]
MDSFTLLYLFYFAKLGSQSSTWFIWRAHSTSTSIPYIAAVATPLAVVPLFHVIVHISMSKPLSSPSLVAYFCFSSVLAFLWYEPMRESHSILLFALVTCCDLTALLIFLLPKAVKWSTPEEGENEQDRGRLLTMEAGQVPAVHARVGFPAPRAPPPSENLHPDISHERPRGQDTEWAWGSFDNVSERVPEPVSGFSASTSPTGVLRDVDSVTVPSPRAMGQGSRTDTIPQLDIGLALGDVGNYDTRSVEEIRFADKPINNPAAHDGQGRLHSQLPAEHVAEIHPYFRPPEQGVHHLDTSHLPSPDIQAPPRLGTPFQPVYSHMRNASIHGNVI